MITIVISTLRSTRNSIGFMWRGGEKEVEKKKITCAISIYDLLVRDSLATTFFRLFFC